MEKGKGKIEKGWACHECGGAEAYFDFCIAFPGGRYETGPALNPPEGFARMRRVRDRGSKQPTKLCRLEVSGDECFL
jgi:hypothetical protein